jgi:WD40-like Beta Propeller Repeat
VLAAILLQRERYSWLAILLIAYIGIGFPTPSPQGETGLAILLYTPRLPLMLGLLLGTYWSLWRDDRTDDRIDAHVDDRSGTPARDWTRYAWARYAWSAAMAVFVITSVRSTLVRERGVRQEYAYRLPLQDQGLLNAHPREAGLGVRYVAFTLNGYRVVSSENSAAASASFADPPDDLSYASSSGHLMVERAGSPLSEIVDLLNPSRVIVSDGRDPMLSADGQSLAFVRDDHGRGRLMLRTAYLSGAASDIALTPPSLNVYEAAFVSKDKYAVSGVEGSHPPSIYLTDRESSKQPLVLDNSRYPAYSPDGRWIAYSHSEHGVWNLWIFDRRTGTIQQVSNVPCNELQPAWLEDSKTLLYSTDCGRSLWFTAVARRKVIP